VAIDITGLSFDAGDLKKPEFLALIHATGCR